MVNIYPREIEEILSPTPGRRGNRSWRIPEWAKSSAWVVCEDETATRTNYAPSVESSSPTSRCRHGIHPSLMTVTGKVQKFKMRVPSQNSDCKAAATKPNERLARLHAGHECGPAQAYDCMLSVRRVAHDRS